MLQTPTTEPKVQTEASRTAVMPEPQQLLHPRFSGMTGANHDYRPGSGPSSGTDRLRQQFAGLQKNIGNQAVLRMLSHSTPVIQTKLTVNQPGDEYEQEADRVADQVMRMEDSAVVPPGDGSETVPAVQRKCACGGGTPCTKCEEEKSERVQRKVGNTSHRAQAFVPDTLSQSLTQGRPLDTATRSFFEPRFGRDFSQVRIHTNPRAAATASAVKALAYTLGNNVVFGPAQYTPATTAGRRLLAHELAHVAQQNAAEPLAPVQVQRLTPGGILQRAISPALGKIEDLLSYGLFDWAITDAEAIEALMLLKQLPKYQQAVFFSEEKYAGRLRDNLPDNRIAELDGIEAGVANILPPSAAIEDINEKLSYGLFDWVVTDAEAISALEKLKQLSGPQLAVAMGAINYGRLLDNLPDSRKQELMDLLAKSLGKGGSREKEEEGHPGTILNSITFKTDHGVMKDNQSNWTAAGSPYGEPEWRINERSQIVSHPISHTMDRNIDIDVGLNVLPVTAPSAPIALRGVSNLPFLNFDFSGSLQGGLNRTVSMTSSGKIPPAIENYKDQEIRWKMKWQDWEHEIGRTKHTVFVTMADPAQPTEVTYKRMNLAVGIVAPSHSLDPHTIVADIMKNWNKYNLAIYYENPWELADDIKAGAQCITIVKFVKAIIETIGCPGVAQAVTISAREGAAGTPIEQICPVCPGLNVPSSHPGHHNWILALLDSAWHANTFEAALKFSYGGVLKYYPGGVDGVLSTPEEVLQVFQCLAWITPTGGGNCKIMEVPPGGEYPHGTCPVGSEHSCGP